MMFCNNKKGIFKLVLKIEKHIQNAIRNKENVFVSWLFIGIKHFEFEKYIFGSIKIINEIIFLSKCLFIICTLESKEMLK